MSNTVRTVQVKKNIIICDICKQEMNFDPILGTKIGIYDVHIDCVEPLIDTEVERLSAEHNTPQGEN